MQIKIKTSVLTNIPPDLWQKKRDSCIMINDYKIAYLYAFNYISSKSKKKARTKWQL